MKKALACLLVAACTAACGSPRSQFGRALNREMDRLREEQFAVEREIEREAEREQQEELALAAAEARGREEALERRNEELRGGENDAVLEMRQALDAAKKNDLDAAHGHAERAAALRPGFVDPLMMMAAIAEQRGDFDGARTRYLEVLKSDPTDVAAGNALGFTYLAQGRFDTAVEWFTRSIEADPGFEAAAYNLGSVAEQQRDLDTAVAWFEVSSALDQRDPRSLTRVARIRLLQGRPEQALAAADAALARHPSSKSAAIARALSLRALGRAE
jgi:tetratricopeptide (TPR) repeat protein